MAAYPPELDFRRLRHVPIEQVLERRGLRQTLRCRAARLVGPCPVHGGDNPTAFVVNRNRNTWYCFTGCQTGGDVVELVRRLEGGYRQAARYLASLAGATTVTPVPSQPAPASNFVPFTRRLPLDPHADLLARKGIHPDTARRFEAGAYHGRGFLAGCVGVRLHDHRGRPLGYLARRLDPEQARRHGKYKLPPALPKNRMLYNLHRTTPVRRHGLVLVECPWAVMRLAQLRIPAVALLGTHLSNHQIRLLADVPRLLLMLDGDPAGHAATTRIHRQLATRADVRVATLPDGLDPDDLSDRLLGASASHLFLP